MRHFLLDTIFCTRLIFGLLGLFASVTMFNKFNVVDFGRSAFGTIYYMPGYYDIFNGHFSADLLGDKVVILCF
jgi:hypothetical protein